MSLGSWKDEFYPVDADEVPESDALAHSLKKWRGMTDEHLVAHSVWANYTEGHLTDDGEDFDGDVFMILDETCALCFHFQHGGKIRCEKCPLRVASGHPCDFVEEPYSVWRSSGDPKPMIAALEAAAKLEAKK